MAFWILNLWKYIQKVFFLNILEGQLLEFTVLHQEKYVIKIGLSINCPRNASGGIITKKLKLEEMSLKNLLWIVYPPLQKIKPCQPKLGITSYLWFWNLWKLHYIFIQSFLKILDWLKFGILPIGRLNLF